MHQPHPLVTPARAGGVCRRADGKRRGWADAVQQLISAGHTWADIQTYTLPQIEAFAAALHEDSRAAALLDLQVARAARCEKGYKTLQKELTHVR
ncbi:hypothetical protein [Pseudomonas sp. zfem003]|uniref:hypothetical protein n=1 Tax=Pseudomonas sp. zfem003 TaxID=3078198 RepID=UPI002928FDCF|nr:hypothetical protein [Pseudomonas sp. zfem003]MDU9400795.1 hypothetical protein [Pseudomonas sp. zfem003]